VSVYETMYIEVLNVCPICLVMHIYIYIVLLYADDTVIFSKSKDHLVSVFNTFTNYCSLWKLNINYDKTKILVFGDRTRRNRNVVVDNHEIETVDSFKFLGVMSSKNRKFTMAKSHAVNQARKAMFCLYKKSMFTN